MSKTKLEQEIVYINNQKLEKSVKNITGETVQLNDLVPFEWDALYTFGPYQSKESNEGMVHLLFVNDNKVVASILGYASNLGYCIDFTAKNLWEISFTENAQFNVTKTDDITTLTYIK